MMEVRYIEWIDSMGGSGWEPLEETRKLRPMKAMTVGFVVEEGDDFVTILQSFDERENGRHYGDNHICIPKFAITKSLRLYGEP